MASRNFSVRLFEIDKEGSLEPILGVDEDYFAGAVPNVGDTYSRPGLEDYTFYAVQRRVFVDCHGGASGWLIIVRKLDATSLLENVVSAWQEDNRFWLDTEEQERLEELERESNQKGSVEWQRIQNEERDKHRPHHKLTSREGRVLRFMIAHPDCLTADTISEAGERTMETLAKVGVVRHGGKDHRGTREWFVTDDGRAEVERIDTYRNWKF